MLYVLPPPAAAAGPPSPWSTILCDHGSGDQRQQEPAGTAAATNNGGRLTYKRNASNNRRVKAWLNAVQKNNRPPPPRKPPLDVTSAAGPEVCVFVKSFSIRSIHIYDTRTGAGNWLSRNNRFFKKIYMYIFFLFHTGSKHFVHNYLLYRRTSLPYQCICAQCTLFV